MKQKEKILKALQESPGKWFLPQDFMQNNFWFVGYEASARMSELAKDYPDDIETKKVGRQFARRWKLKGSLF